VKSPSGDSTQVLDAVEALREEVRRLGERVAALEAHSRHHAPRDEKAITRSVMPTEPISEEILAVISAAIAAFLGKKPTIRQIRLLAPTAWAQQGRVTIQASHALSSRQLRSPH
jgi:methylmalonyl-CoA carboxyltransferase large subunit